MPIQIKGPDGTINQFPDGMADADIEKVMAEHYPQPSIMDRVAAFPIVRGAHDLIGGMVGGATRGPMDLARSITDMLPGNGATMAGTPLPQQAPHNPGDPLGVDASYEGALARNRNTPGYAKERALADQAMAGHGGFQDQMFAPFLPAVAGTAGLLGGLDSSNAMADSQAAAQAGYQKEHPVLSFGANLAGGLLTGAPEGASTMLANQPRPIRVPTLRPGAAAAHDAGYVLPPRMISDRPGVIADAMSGWSGKVKTAQSASARNQEVTNTLAARSLGLPEDTVLTDHVFQNVRRDAGQAYAAIPDAVPTIAVDQDFVDTITGLGERSGQAAQAFPDLMRNDHIETLVDNLAGQNAPRQFPTDAGIQLVRRLRSDANTNFRAAGDPARVELAFAQRRAADELDNLIERNLDASGQGHLAGQYRAARTQIARSHDVEAATNTATGNVSARRISALAARGRPLTGDLETISNTAAAFPKAMQSESVFGEVEPFSVLDVAAAAAALPHNPSLLGAVLGRPIARGALLSRPVQNMMTNAALRGRGVPMPLPQLPNPPPLPYGALPLLTQPSPVGTNR